MLKPRYEIFDHTADAGIRIFAPTLAELLEPAAEGLYAVIGETAIGARSRRVSFDLSGSDAALLLRDYLAELLFLFEHEGVVIRTPLVSTFDAARLAADADAFRVDVKRSVFLREVKAITYHELEIRSVPGGVEATVIVDI